MSSNQANGALFIDIEGQELTTEDKQLLVDPRIGGIIFFKRNYTKPEQMMALVEEIRAQRSDLVLCVDQEGGRVQRFVEGMTQLPSLRSLANAGEDACRDLAWLMASEVMALGIDISFAPVLDIDYGRNTVIADRSFGTSADKVIAFANAYLQGLNEAGMAATGKHFPGHGWVELDSHVALPSDERRFDEIEAHDLRVFSALHPQLVAMMTAHVCYECNGPMVATYSEFWLDHLRQTIGFTGLIVSDDLAMAGALRIGDITARARAACRAGCDLLLVCNDREAVKHLLKADDAWLTMKSLEPLRCKQQQSWTKLHALPRYQEIQARWQHLLGSVSI